jgi:hypothetical protein
MNCLISTFCPFSSFPEEKFAPPIGNGHIATNVLSDTIYMNGFYSGYKEDSHRARLQSTAAVNVKYYITTTGHILNILLIMYPLPCLKYKI